MNDRLDKLLQSEYKHIYEPTFIESAFAEVDYRGNGIRQTYLGLTKTNFIICNERLPSAYTSLLRCTDYVDPETECLDVCTVIPLKLCQFRLRTKHQRKFISVKVANDDSKEVFFEFGEHLMRCFYYDVWSESIFCLNNFPQEADTIIDVGNDSGDNLKVENEKSSTQAKVHALKRRVDKLNHNIKTQFEKVTVKEVSAEALPLLKEHEKKELQELAVVHSPTGLSSSKKKPVTTIYKKSPRQSLSSVANIWF